MVDNNIVVLIGKRLASLRERDGYTQVDLSKKLNVSPSTIAMWELGERELKGSNLRRIADFFDVSTDYLTGKSDTPSSLTKEGISIAYYGGAKTEEEKEFLDEQLEIFRIRKAIREQEKKNNNE
jgi:transcriptional regulator with XRE-family HTH domain